MKNQRCLAPDDPKTISKSICLHTRQTSGTIAYTSIRELQMATFWPASRASAMTTPLTHQCTAASLDGLSPAYSELHHLAPVQPTEPVPDHNVGAAAGLPLRTMWIQLDHIDFWCTQETVAFPWIVLGVWSDSERSFDSLRTKFERSTVRRIVSAESSGLRVNNCSEPRASLPT
jgi:hypothetical protein